MQWRGLYRSEMLCVVAALPSTVYCCSVAKSCPTLCDPRDVPHHPPEFTQVHGPWISDAVRTWKTLCLSINVPVPWHGCSTHTGHPFSSKDAWSSSLAASPDHPHVAGSPLLLCRLLSLFSLPRLYLASPLNGTRRPQVSGVQVTPGSHLGERMVYLPPQEAHHLNPAVSASWQPPQRPSPQETKQTLSPEFPCFFSSKSPVATKLQLRGRIKGTGGLWGCGTHTELCPFLTLCFLGPAASVFVPLGAQVSEGGAEGRQVRVGGAALQTSPDSKSLPTDRTHKRQMKSRGGAPWEGVGGIPVSPPPWCCPTTARPSRQSRPHDACRPQHFIIKYLPCAEMRCDSPSPPLLRPCSGLWDAPRESNTPSAGKPLHILKDNKQASPDRSS